MEYTKGETAGGWVYILKGKTPIALVHPKHIDKFLAAPDLYEACKATIGERALTHTDPLKAMMIKAIAKAES